MAISELPLSYCTNVHPGRTLDEVIANLEKYAVPVAERYGHPMGVGLWLPNTVVEPREGAPDCARHLSGWLNKHRIVCHTMNAFPYGDFHQRSVKESVYLPNWLRDGRFDYTVQVCGTLFNLLRDSREGSVSTLPLGFKAHAREPDFVDQCCQALVAFGSGLEGFPSHKLLRLALEPEPLCVVETTEETVAFFERLWRVADREGQECGDRVREHIGLCYDICHQAVEFEEPEDAIARIHEAGIRINKVQISNAIEVKNPASNEAARAALRDYVDERYLHQTFGLDDDGRVHRVVDLTHEFLDDPGEAMLGCHTWRIHYHVPVNERTIGVLDTTQDHVRRALAAIAKLPYAPHLEVETYTWSVLPGEQPDLVTGLANEMTAVRAMLDELRVR